MDEPKPPVQERATTNKKTYAHVFIEIQITSAHIKYNDQYVTFISHIHTRARHTNIYRLRSC